MWSDATRNIVRGLMGAGSLAGSTLGSCSLAFATLAALGAVGVGGWGGGVGGSSMIRVRSLGFLGALSFAPAGLPRLLGSGVASSLGIVGSFSKTCSLCSLCSAICLYKGKSVRRFYLIVTVILQLGRLVKRS